MRHFLRHWLCDSCRMLSPKSSLLYSKPDFGDNMRQTQNYESVAYCHQNPVYYIVDWILVTTCDKVSHIVTNFQTIIKVRLIFVKNANVI